ncbi:MAG: tetratricopeptide repeat protein [Myxococcales bacterium]
MDAAGHRARQQVEIFAKNALGETRYAFTVDVVAPGKAPKVEPRIPYWPSMGPDVAFAAQLPAQLPAGCDAALLMGVQAVQVDLSTETMQGGFSRKRLATDLVYTIFTREGREVETTRVRVEGVPSAFYRHGVSFAPKRSSWLDWSEAGESRLAPLDETKLFAATAEASAAAFLFPYAEHKMVFSAQLDESSPALKPGIELSNKDNFEAAFGSFESAAKADPTLAGAFYNMGVMREVQGRDEEALALYRKAVGLKPGEGMYVRALKALESRAKHREPLVGR